MAQLEILYAICQMYPKSYFDIIEVTPINKYLKYNYCRNIKTGNSGSFAFGKTLFKNKGEAIDALIKLIDKQKFEIATKFNELCKQEKDLLNSRKEKEVDCEIISTSFDGIW